MGAARIVSLENVSKSYGNKRALIDVNLQIRKGESFVLLGPNGSGKSTLLRILAGLLSPDDGRVELFEKSILKNRKEVQSRIGILFDHNAQWEKLTGYQSSWYFARSYGIHTDKARDNLDRLFLLYGLWENRDELISTYSYGMRRKLALIQAMSHNPRLLILDEPSMGLDYESRLALYRILKEESRRDTTVVLAINDVNEAALLAQRVAILNRGRIIITGKPEELKASLEALTLIVIWLGSPIPLTPLYEIEGVEQVEVCEETEDNIMLKILAQSQRSILTRIVREVVGRRGTIKALEVKEPDLGDVLLKFTSDEDM